MGTRRLRESFATTQEYLDYMAAWEQETVKSLAHCELPMTPGVWYRPGDSHTFPILLSVDYHDGSLVITNRSDNPLVSEYGYRGHWLLMIPATVTQAKMLEALQFYANAENWKEQETGIGMQPSDAEMDSGNKARALLTPMEKPDGRTRA